jgi:hypothetical protein
MPDDLSHMNERVNEKLRERMQSIFNNKFLVETKEPEPTLRELKESIDELTRYLKPYSGNLLIGKSAVDAYEKLISGRLK